ncbi:MAG: hypothetical protein FJZ56_01100 [Chlamydiae bacterium]|nr:hypothetical protein [Chlamydiota bacterium]
MEKILEEMIDQQENKLLSIAQRYVHNISKEDLLQPFDYPILENHPYFRYEEGVLQGMKMVQAAFRAELFSSS